VKTASEMTYTVSGTLLSLIQSVRYKVPALIRTLFYFKPESGVHVTEMIIYDLFLFNLHLVTVPGVIITAFMANSSSSSL